MSSCVDISHGLNYYYILLFHFRGTTQSTEHRIDLARGNIL